MAGFYTLMTWMGLTIKSNVGLVSYLLTVLCSALPVAASAGLIRSRDAAALAASGSSVIVQPAPPK